jgi:hypothetical protein
MAEPGESGEVKVKESEGEILEVLSNLAKAQSYSIAKTLGKDYSNTHKRLSTLWTAGKIKKGIVEGRTFYFLPRDKEDKEVPTMST